MSMTNVSKFMSFSHNLPKKRTCADFCARAQIFCFLGQKILELSGNTDKRTGAATSPFERRALVQTSDYSVCIRAVRYVKLQVEK